MQFLNKYGVFIFLFLFILTLIIINKFHALKLQKDHVYTIGRIYEQSKSNRGTTYRYEFFLSGQRFKGSVKEVASNHRINDLIFLKVNPKDPEILRLLYTNVPYCLSLDSVPKQGWKELPKIECK